MHLAKEMEKSTADKTYMREFQGKPIYKCRNMCYWFRWGKWTFDIRDIRAFYGKKEDWAMDKLIKVIDGKTVKQQHPCTQFQKQVSQIIALIGEEPIEAVFDRAREAVKEQRKKEQEKRAATVASFNDDDFPF